MWGTPIFFSSISFDVFLFYDGILSRFVVVIVDEEFETVDSGCALLSYDADFD